MEIKPNSSKKVLWFLPLLVPLLLGLCWILFLSQPGKDPKHSSQPYDFSVQTLDGSPFVLSAHRGHFVLVDFWSTSCGPCVEMLPVLHAFYQMYHPLQVDLIAIQLSGDDKARARQKVKELQLNFPIGIDDAGWVANHYQVSVVPSMLIIDPDGKVRKTLQGFHSLDELRLMMSEVGVGGLKEPQKR